MTDWVTSSVQCFTVGHGDHYGNSLQKHSTLGFLLPAVGRVDALGPGLALSALLGYYLIFSISKSWKSHDKASFNKHVSYNITVVASDSESVVIVSVFRQMCSINSKIVLILGAFELKYIHIQKEKFVQLFNGNWSYVVRNKEISLWIFH